MENNVQKKLVELSNEVKAQKVYSGLAYSNLLLPENTPTLTYSGTASLSGSGGSNTPVARLRFRFTRDDGLLDPPLINFAFTANFTPHYKDFLVSQGFSISGSDLDYFDWIETYGYINEAGDGYVDYYVDFDATIRDYYFSVSSISLTVTCQAISNVYGSFVVERLI